MAHSACALVRGDTQRSDGYVRRRPEASVLYQVVAKHWPLLLEGLEDAGGLPRFVKQEFEEYLRCGILEHGCLHLVCRQCGLSQVVALSCKKRGFCPACLGRRMADTAVHLERSVLPAVPIRHWICSLPWGLRALPLRDLGRGLPLPRLPPVRLVPSRGAVVQEAGLLPSVSRPPHG